MPIGHEPLLNRSLTSDGLVFLVGVCISRSGVVASGAGMTRKTIPSSSPFSAAVPKIPVHNVVGGNNFFVSG